MTAYACAANARDSAPFVDPPPGTSYRVTLKDLPAPFATPAVANSPSRVVRPASSHPRVPDGFHVTLFADHLTHARWLAVAPDDAVFVAESRSGQITRLIDKDGDGHADQRTVWARGLDRPHGLAFGNHGLYVGDRQAVWYFPHAAGAASATEPPRQVTPDGALGSPDGHWTRTVTLSPDERSLFVAIGSRSNVDEEPLPRASVQVFSLQDHGRRAVDQKTWASGLRNPVGLAFNPQTHTLWTVVNERDGLGDELVPDYLAALYEGDFFGWPHSYLGSHPQPDLRADPQQRSVRLPDVLFQSHSAPLGLTFITHPSWPAQWQGDALVAFHGSWNAAHPRGYMIVRVPFSDGKPVGDYTVFASGFVLAGEAASGAWQTASFLQVWGRPVGLAFDSHGALYVADDVGQTIWKIRP